tara:strand:- start:1028 stop:1165 length:138 start_codon:yes stop_codon:yes gene_type:complete
MNKIEKKRESFFKKIISFCSELFLKKRKPKKEKNKNSSDDIYPLW